MLKIVVAAVSFGSFTLFITSKGLLNFDFVTFWVELGIIPINTDPFVLWGKAVKGLLIGVALALLIDSAVNLVKVFRHRISV